MLITDEKLGFLVIFLGQIMDGNDTEKSSRGNRKAFREKCKATNIKIEIALLTTSVKIKRSSYMGGGNIGTAKLDLAHCIVENLNE